MISRLPAQKGRQHSFQVALWPKFHVFRTQVAQSIWNKYFELKNSWGADGAPQTRTTC